MKQLFGVLLLVGIVLTYWKWFAIVAAVALIAFWLKRAAELRELDRRRWVREKQAIRRRADQQHAWASEGDPRGTFGEGYVGLTS